MTPKTALQALVHSTMTPRRAPDGAATVLPGDRLSSGGLEVLWDHPAAAPSSYHLKLR